MKWYIIDKDYVKYLHEFDDKVENIEYAGKIKPYIGIILNINEFSYYVPVSSAKTKHEKLKNNIDLFKIEDKNGLYGILNINNMIPVLNEYLTKLNYREIEKYRSFSSELEKVNYIRLLSKELAIINSNDEVILKNARKLYEVKSKFPESKIAIRCCDFKLLECKANEYKNSISTNFKFFES